LLFTLFDLVVFPWSPRPHVGVLQPRTPPPPMIHMWIIKLFYINIFYVINIFSTKYNNIPFTILWT
jgi:hypothetical protein